jgi:predicted  nucleic acid-binding Zn-ribbon protein
VRRRRRQKGVRGVEFDYGGPRCTTFRSQLDSEAEPVLFEGCDDCGEVLFRLVGVSKPEDEQVWSSLVVLLAELDEVRDRRCANQHVAAFSYVLAPTGEVALKILEGDAVIFGWRRGPADREEEKDRGCPVRC